MFLYNYCLEKSAFHPDVIMEDLLKSVPIETTLIPLKKLLNKGYQKVVFIAVDESCPICLGLNGKIWKLKTFIKNANYDAPIYTKTHPGCDCIMKIIGEELKPELINYTGTSPKLRLDKKGRIRYGKRILKVRRKRNEKDSNK